MNKKLSIVVLIILFLLLYFLQDPLISLIGRKEFNLETKQIHFEEDYQQLKKDYEELLGFKSQELNSVISKVIIRDPLEFFDEMTILKGEEENITIGSAVLNEQGLVGVIKKVNKHTSIVQLITNKETKIAVKIGDVYGLLESEDGILKIKNITNKDHINPNSPIVTSDFGVLQANLLIGKTKEMHHTNQNLSLEIIVEPAVDFEQLNYVTIKGALKNE